MHQENRKIHMSKKPQSRALPSHTENTGPRKADVGKGARPRTCMRKQGWEQSPVLEFAFDFRKVLSSLVRHGKENYRASSKCFTL